MAESSLRFPTHTTYYNSLFVLRTDITLNGQKAVLDLEPNLDGELVLHCRHPAEKCIAFQSIFENFEGILKKHGVSRVTNFFCGEMPIFEVSFANEQSVNVLLHKKDMLEKKIAGFLATELNLEGSQVKVIATLFLMSPDHTRKTCAAVREVTSDNWREIISIWKGSIVFDFADVFRTYYKSPEDFNKAGACEVELKYLQTELVDVVEWYEFGVAVGVRSPDLLKIKFEENIKNIEGRKLEMLRVWKTRVEPTWSVVVKALAAIGMVALARQIATKYGVPSPPMQTASNTQYMQNLVGDDQNVTEEQTKLKEANEELKSQLKLKTKEVQKIKAEFKDRHQVGEDLKKKLHQRDAVLKKVHGTIKSLLQQIKNNSKQLKCTSGRLQEIKSEKYEEEFKLRCERKKLEEEQIREAASKESDNKYLKLLEEHYCKLEFAHELEIEIEELESIRKNKHEKVEKYSHDLNQRQALCKRKSFNDDNIDEGYYEMVVQVSDLEEKLAEAINDQIEVVRKLKLLQEKHQWLQKEHQWLQDHQPRAAPKSCMAEGPGLTSAELEKESKFFIHLTSATGFPCTVQEKVVAELWQFNSKVTETAFKTTCINPAKYEVCYIPTKRGRTELCVAVNGIHIKGSPFPLFVKISPKKITEPLSQHTITPGIPWRMAISSNGSQVTLDGEYISLRCLDQYYGTNNTIKSPNGVAVDGYDNIYITDGHTDQVVVLDINLSCIGCIGKKGSKDGQFHNPGAIAVDWKNRMYVCDQGNQRIQVFNIRRRRPSRTSYERTYYENPRYSTNFKVKLHSQHYLSVDSDCNLYLTNASDSGSRVHVYTDTGEPLREFNVAHGVEHGCVHSDHIYFTYTDSNLARVLVYTLKGETFSAIKAPDGMKTRALTIDKDGYIYLCLISREFKPRASFPYNIPNMYVY